MKVLICVVHFWLLHCRFLGKPLTVECNQKSSANLQSTELDLTVGLTEIVECVFDRRGTTHSILGFSRPIDNILPDYCPVSMNIFLYYITRQRSCFFLRHWMKIIFEKLYPEVLVSFPCWSLGGSTVVLKCVPKDSSAFLFAITEVIMDFCWQF